MTSDIRGNDDVKVNSEPNQAGQELSSSQCVSNTRSRTQNSTRVTNIVQNTDNSKEESGISPDKISRSCTLGQRTSNRISKRPKRDSSPPATQTQLAAKKNVSKQTIQQDQLKTRRTWELWSVEDKNAFFEALCEYGKDFESIQSYIAQRSRKKGVPPNMIKNKDQVRHFYYRTWHKISKYLDIGDDVKKQTQELYGLINYAELRKKIGGCLSEKNRQQLNELVFNGVTFIKYRGKKLRIKTPVCRALKKLNNVEDTKEPEIQKMPKEVVVEFRPHNNAAWLHVQSLAQNPRVRAKLSLQRHLKTVFEYLQKRWKPYRLRQKEQILSGVTNSSVLTSTEQMPLLHIRPRQNANISFVKISPSDVTTSGDVCLENYKKNIAVDNVGEKESLKKNKTPGRLKNKSDLKLASLPVNKEHVKTNNSDKMVKLDKSNEEEKPSIYNTNNNVPEKNAQEENPAFEAQRSLNLLKGMLNSMNENSSVKNCNEQVSHNEDGNNIKINEAIDKNCKSIEQIYLNAQKDANNLTLGQLLSLASSNKTEENVEEKEDKTATTSESDVPVNNINHVPKNQNHCEANNILTEEKIDTIRKGWTEQTIGMLTVGELYLMLGSPEKIVLEYDWEQPAADEKTLTDAKNENVLSENVQKLQNLTLVLQKLLQMASTTFNDFKTKQQEPLSPTCRNNNRSTNANSAGKPNTSRNSTRNPNIRSGVRGNQTSNIKNASQKCSEQNLETTNNCQSAIKTMGDNITNINQTSKSSANDNIQADKHVFVVPVGTAPRTVKQPVIASPDDIREQLDKFIPTLRRGGSRMRSRKPLVVQRPLLPRGGIGPLDGSQPMTVVHLVPSSSQITPITAVIPSTANRGAGSNKVVLPQPKKVVKLLPTGTPVNMQPIPVPILKTVGNNSGNVVLPANNISTAQIVVSTSTVVPTLATTASNVTTSVQHVTSDLATILSTSESTAASHETTNKTLSNSPISTIVSSTSSSVTIQHVPLDVLSTAKNPSLSNICITTTCSSSPPQISIPENTSSPTPTSPPDISSLLDISLSEANLQTESIPEPGSGHLLGFNENSDSSLSAAFGLPSSLSSNKIEKNIGSTQTCISSCLSRDPVVAARQSTPPQSPPSSSHFRICSPVPENHWLNGESADFSLSSLLNTLESPCKPTPVVPSINITTDSSNLDPIARLAPDVDTQLQCLMNESSVDYVAKFADLAAQIASTSSAETKST
ncbi:protein cramped-like isoform X2 [Centruroides vittatus]